MTPTSERRGFYKGFVGFRRSTEREELVAAESSIYYWWWAYARLSAAFWFARTFEHPPSAADVRRAQAQLGDLESHDFRRWWMDTGRDAFAESVLPPRVEVLDLKTLAQRGLREGALLFEVPLTIRKQTLLKQIREELNKRHDGRNLDLAKTSRAALALHTKRYRLHVVEAQYWVLLYRLLHPGIENWRIGDRLQLAPHVRVRGVDRINNPKAFNFLGSLTGRHLYKARFMLRNLEHGRFPDVSPTDGDKPMFGRQERLFRMETDPNNEGCDWQRWLTKRYGKLLRDEVARRNRIELGSATPRQRGRFDAFVEGASDLL